MLPHSSVKVVAEAPKLVVEFEWEGNLETGLRADAVYLEEPHSQTIEVFPSPIHFVVLGVMTSHSHSHMVRAQDFGKNIQWAAFVSAQAALWDMMHGLGIVQ
jgi:hypothetical protein